MKVYDTADECGYTYLSKLNMGKIPRNTPRLSDRYSGVGISLYQTFGLHLHQVCRILNIAFVFVLFSANQIPEFVHQHEL